MANEPSTKSRSTRALFTPAEPMNDGRYIFLLVTFVLSVVVFVVALFAGREWWLAVSAVLTGVSSGGTTFLERQRRTRERANRRRVASPD